MATQQSRGALERFRALRRDAYDYRYEASLDRKVAMAIGMAAFTGLMAKVAIPLPYVPITGQTFAVLVAGVILGGRWGGISMGIYSGAGIAGVPWFQGPAAGLGYFLGSTGGYIIGFVATAVVIGYAIDHFPATRRLPWLALLLAFGNFVVIFAFGLPWLAAHLMLVEGMDLTVMTVLQYGYIPFVAGGVVKVLAATAVARMILPPEPADGAETAESLADA